MNHKQARDIFNAVSLFYIAEQAFASFSVYGFDSII